MDLREAAMAKEKFKRTLKDISYYLIVGIISIIVMFVAPLLTGCLQGDLSLYFPTTAEEWIIYIIMKVALAFANVAIFVLFKLQAKVNVKDNENFKEANAILNRAVYSKENNPRSPAQMNAAEYISKGTTVFISTIISSVIITNLLISFDLITFISCIVSTVISILFGWTTMLNNEIYWTDEYLRYAKQVSAKAEEGVNKNA